MANKQAAEYFNRRLPPRELPEGLTQVYKRGAVLILAAGFVTEGGADPVGIIGLAARDGQNGAANGDKQASVAMAYPTELFIMNIGGAAAIAAADLGTKYGIVKEADNLWYVDKADAVNTRVVIVDFVDPVGEVNGRVVVKFLDAQTLWGS